MVDLHLHAIINLEFSEEVGTVHGYVMLHLRDIFWTVKVVELIKQITNRIDYSNLTRLTRVARLSPLNH